MLAIIQLSKLKCLTSWKDAAPGLLLQFPDDKGTGAWIGARCFNVNKTHGLGMARVLVLKANWQEASKTPGYWRLWTSQRMSTSARKARRLSPTIEQDR
jgi:NADH:ubiquinone oxidoreductase subunit